MSSSRRKPQPEQPPQQPFGQQPEGPAAEPAIDPTDMAEAPVRPFIPEATPYPAPPVHAPGEYFAPQSHEPYQEVPESDEQFLADWAAEREAPVTAEVTTPSTPEGEANKDRRAFRRTKKGLAWLGTAAVAAVIGFGGSAVADQVVERDGILATDSRETGEFFISMQETVTEPAQYLAEGMLAVGGLVVTRRMGASALRGTKRAYRAKFPKKEKNNRGNSSEAES